MTRKPKAPKPPKIHGEYALSAKRLAELNTPNLCERCFWVRHRMHGVGRDAPYSFPVAGLLSRIDSMEKKLVYATLPSFLGAYKGQELLKLHRMSYIDARTGVELTGVPDLAFRDAQRNISVIDLKSSKPRAQEVPASGDKESNAKIISIYGGQLHVYKKLLEARGEGRVTRLIIMSLWPEEMREDKQVNGIAVSFKASELVLSVDDGLVDRLMERARKILVSKRIPAPLNDCLDCVRVAHFMSIFGVQTERDERVLANVNVEIP